jgi:ParB family transcriptional regulator, chromosome partitioning protein
VSQKIPIDLIDRNVDQPRKTFDAALLNELADSLLAEGQLQPITVRTKPGGLTYEIVLGERRWRAHRLLVERGHAQFSEIDCIVREMDDLTRDIAAIVENLQRKDVTCLEESDAFMRLLLKGVAPFDIATRCGVPLLRVKWRLSLQNLAPEIKHLLASGNLDQQAANEIARLPAGPEQFRMLKLFQSGKLGNWKAVRAAVDAILERKSQADIFGEDTPRASEEDVKTLTAMEQRIERMAAMASQGWRDGECIVATKVSRDRTRLMADKLAAMRTAIGTMERDLRNVAAQADAVLL